MAFFSRFFEFIYVLATEANNISNDLEVGNCGGSQLNLEASEVSRFYFRQKPVIDFAVLPINVFAMIHLTQENMVSIKRVCKPVVTNSGPKCGLLAPF